MSGGSSGRIGEGTGRGESCVFGGGAKKEKGLSCTSTKGGGVESGDLLNFLQGTLNSPPNQS